MKLLDFMIIGAQKSGTTALADFVSQHTEVEVASGKEVHLFDDPDFDESWTRERISAQYAPYFHEDDVDKVVGEATPIYLFFPEVAGRLHSYNPDLKLIVILRDPVQRAYSHYLMEKARGTENQPFWLALLLEKVRLFLDRNPLSHDSAFRTRSYRARGLYYNQLLNLFSFFPKEQVLIIQNEELKNSHDVTLERVFSFLGLRDQQTRSKLVFSRLTDVARVPVSAFFLRKSYQRELRRLKSILDFDVESWV